MVEKEEKPFKTNKSKKIHIKDVANSDVKIAAPINFLHLFRYSSRSDKLLMFVGCIIAVCIGASIPIVIVLLGNIVDTFIEIHIVLSDEVTNNAAITGNNTILIDDFLAHISRLSSYIAAVGAITFCCNYVMVSFFSMAAVNQAFKIKCLFMKAVLRQDIGWFDTNQTGEFATRLTGDLTRVQDGIGEKVCICLSFLSQGLVSITCALVFGWKLTLVMLCIMPILIVSIAVISKIQAKVAGSELSSYSTAGSIAEEVLSSIKTVASFGGERKEIERYDKHLKTAQKQGIERGLLTGIGAGIIWFGTYCAYALAFWYGTKLIVEGRTEENAEYKPSTLTIVFFNIMFGAIGIGQTAPYFEAFSIAKGAAAEIYKIIERTPPIDSSSEKGIKPALLNGAITLKDVKFKYPARPDVQVLKGLSLEIKSGETVALVGSSGCGKSTIIQLIQRFYDADSGHVLIDGNDVQNLNVGSLRDAVGIVRQEPILFSTTIAENIRYGKSDATQEDIENASRAANVHEFIQGLPENYDTLVGERGTQLSGGQKQRIAIARALIRNPKILLLDEATSALDTESESVVQAALDEARKGRTTVIVAHRLSTVRTADKIVAIADGKVKETGTHTELMALKGLYYHLVITQVGDVFVRNSVLKNDVVGKTAIALQLNRNVIGPVSHICDSPINRIRFSDVERSLWLGRVVKNVEKDIDSDAELSRLRLLKISRPEWPYLATGSICGLLSGLFPPIYGILFGEILGLLSQDDNTILSRIPFYSLMFLAIAFASGISTFLQISMLSIVGERLTSRLRKMCFTNIICQDMAWFDRSHNSIGTLCSKLSSDASDVQGVGGSRIATVVQAISTLIATIVIGLYYNYKVGLVVLAFIPLVLLATYLESNIITGNILTDKSAIEDASKIAVEAIENIRTVASLHQEHVFYCRFRTALMSPLKKSRITSHIRGIIYGFAQSIPSFAYAVALFYGSQLVVQREMFYGDLFKVLEAVIVGTVTIGQAIAFTPDYQKGRTAAVRIFKLLDQKPKHDIFKSEGEILQNVSGRLEFRNVYFNYPSRPRVKILKGLNLSIKPGTTVALVGTSGCGKSTCIQLIQRFYDAQQGEVIIEDKAIESIDLSSLRSQVGLVSQEPVLFRYSLAENIAYGDNSREVPMAEIIEAAKNANIHNFISALPKGYYTDVGDKGTQLSGGQKQRIAIARALVRNPKILLLDEATSALDAESEKVVQEALDNASAGRTCITIAHRLTTIQNADKIYVIHKGRAIEKGTHRELLALRGHYYNLHHVQSKS